MNLKRLLPLLIVPLLLTACPSGANRTKNGPDLRNLPREIRSGEQGPFHVQGIAVDLERGYIYFSFTTKLLKMDFEGNLIGSVDGMTGHLGCLTMNPADGRVYGSLEYKDDAIGKGIRRTLDAGQVAPEDEKDRTGFYVAIFDVDRITRPDMDAEKDRVMTTVYIKEAVDDYFATAENGGRTVEHRFGCSGIDGVTFAPGSERRRAAIISMWPTAFTATPCARTTITRCCSPTTRRAGSVSSSRSRREVCIKAALRRPITSISSARATPRGEFRTWPMIPRRETAMPRFTKVKNLNTPIIRSL